MHKIELARGEIPNKPEPGKIYFVGEAGNGDVIIIPKDYGRVDDYFLMLSLPIGGIPGDSHFPDNGFSGFAASASPLKPEEGEGWRISAISADNLESGASGGMANVTPRTRGVKIHYAAIRIR